MGATESSGGESVMKLPGDKPKSVRTPSGSTTGKPEPKTPGSGAGPSLGMKDSSEDSYHNVVIVGPESGLNENLIDWIKETESKLDCRIVSSYSHSHRSKEFLFEESQFRVHVPSHWGQYELGKRKAATTTIIFNCDLHLNVLVKDQDAAKALLFKRLELILNEFEELCKESWVRKCSIIVFVTGIPQTNLTGELDALKFTSNSEFLQSLQMSFKLRCPKLWNAMIFTWALSVKGFDLRRGIRQSQAKMNFEVDEARVAESSGSIKVPEDGSLSHISLATDASVAVTIAALVEDARKEYWTAVAKSGIPIDRTTTLMLSLTESSSSG